MSIRIDKYEVWVTTSLTDDQKMEIARTLAKMAEENGSKHRVGTVSRHIGIDSIESFASTVA